MLGAGKGEPAHLLTLIVYPVMGRKSKKGRFTTCRRVRSWLIMARAHPRGR